MAEINNAIANATTLHIHYQSIVQETTEREIEPIGLVFYGMNWHVITWCWKRNDYRDFKASRILKLSNTYSLSENRTISILMIT